MKEGKAYIGDEIAVSRGNKLIDYFMGERPKRHLYDYEVNCFYHTSWSWIMPVVAKISNIYNQSDFEMALELKECPSMILDLKLCGPSIENIWEECVKFITWYNNQNKQS